jgi:hypothetical protein
MMGSLVFMLGEIGSTGSFEAGTAVLLAVTLIALALFIHRERRVPDPLLRPLGVQG